MNKILLSEKEKSYLEIDTEKHFVVDGEGGSFLNWLDTCQLYEKFVSFDFKANNATGSLFVKLEGPVMIPIPLNQSFVYLGVGRGD